MFFEKNKINFKYSNSVVREKCYYKLLPDQTEIQSWHDIYQKLTENVRLGLWTLNNCVRMQCYYQNFKHGNLDGVPRMCCDNVSSNGFLCQTLRETRWLDIFLTRISLAFKINKQETFMDNFYLNIIEWMDFYSYDFAVNRTVVPVGINGVILIALAADIWINFTYKVNEPRANIKLEKNTLYYFYFYATEPHTNIKIEKIDGDKKIAYLMCIFFCPRKQIDLVNFFEENKK